MNMEDGATSQGIQAATGCLKRQGNRFIQEMPEGTSPAYTLISAQGN